MRRSPFAPLVPFRGNMKPQWPYRVNLDSPQAEDLRFWFSGDPPGSGQAAVVSQPGPLDQISGVMGTNNSSADWLSGTSGEWGIGGSGTYVWTNPGSIIYPTTGCTILAHVIAGGGAAFASWMTTNGGAGNCIATYFPYVDANAYFDFGGTGSPNRIFTAPTFTGDDLFVFTAGARGSEIWQNGVLLTSQATPITAAASGDLTLTASASSNLAEWRMNGVQFSQALCQQMSEPMGRWDLFAPIRQRSWVFYGIAGAGAATKAPPPMYSRPPRFFRRSA